MNLNIATGIKTITLTGVGTAQVSFNPTDMNFVEKLYRAFSELEEKNKVREEQIDAMTGEEAFDLCREVDKAMRQTIDGLFGCEVCAPLFGSMSIYAMADGSPAWENLMFAIIDQCDETLAAEKLKRNPRIKKWMDKYKRT